jgi:hypothetical protein
MKKLLINLNILPLNKRVLSNGMIIKIYKNGNIKTK